MSPEEAVSRAYDRAYARGYSHGFAGGTAPSGASATTFPGSSQSATPTPPPGAVFVGSYTYQSAGASLSGGPVGVVPAAVPTAAKALGAQPGAGASATVGQFYLVVTSYAYNQSDWTSTIDVYALPDSVLVYAPPVAVQPTATRIDTHFHGRTGTGAMHTGSQIGTGAAMDSGARPNGLAASHPGRTSGVEQPASPTGGNGWYMNTPGLLQHGGMYALQVTAVDLLAPLPGLNALWQNVQRAQDGAGVVATWGGVSGAQASSQVPPGVNVQPYRVRGFALGPGAPLGAPHPGSQGGAQQVGGGQWQQLQGTAGAPPQVVQAALNMTHALTQAWGAQSFGAQIDPLQVFAPVIAQTINAGSAYYAVVPNGRSVVTFRWTGGGAPPPPPILQYPVGLTPTGTGAPPAGWRPHTGTYPSGLGATPKLHRGQWLARHDNKILMHPRAGFGAVSGTPQGTSTDALFTAAQALLAALQASSGYPSSISCSDTNVIQAATVFQAAYNSTMGPSPTINTGAYDAATAAALTATIQAYQALSPPVALSSGSAAPACTGTSPAQDAGASTTPADNSQAAAAAATPAATNYTPYYVAGAAVLALGGYYAWKKKVF